MRGLIYLILLAALGYSAYWFVGSTAQQTALSAWLDQQRNRGWLAEASEINVTGFPNRFDAIISDLKLGDPAFDWVWNAPEFQILALSYKPNHIIAAWPGKQSIASPYEQIDVTSELMRGSVRFAPNTGLALQEARVELDQVEIASTLGYTGGLESGFLAIRLNDGEPAPDIAYDVSFQAKQFRLAEPIKQALDPSDGLPAALENMNLRMTPVYDAVWDRAAIEGRKPQLQTLRDADLNIKWGPLEFRLRGRLDVDENGYGAGRMNLTAKNWREIIALSIRAGWLQPDFADVLQTWIGVVAKTSGNADNIDIPLTFEDGLAKLGPVPLLGSFDIGQAPKLVHLQ